MTRAQRMLPAFAALALVLAALFSGWPVNHDNAAYLQIGELLLSGAVPYVDYVELNPPIIHYVHVLPAALHAALGTSLPATFLVCVLAWCLTSAFLLHHLLRASGFASAGAAAVITGAWLCFSSFILCNNGLGQREHLFVLAFGPWIVGRAARHDGAALPWVGMLALGLLTGVFSVLKPNLLATIGVCELWLLFRSRRTRALFSVDALALAAVGLAYGLHFLLVPEAMRSEFFGRWVPFVASNYSSYGNPLGEIVTSDIGIAVILALAASVACLPLLRRRDQALRPLLEALCLGSLLGAAGFIAQGKGWYYHAYPCLGSTLLLLSLLAANPPAAPDGDRADALGGRLRLRLATASLYALTLGFTGFAFAFGPGVQQAAREIAVELERDSRPGDTVAFIDTSTQPGATALLYADRMPGIRFLPAFPIAFFHPAQGSAGGSAADRARALDTAAEERFLEELAQDIRGKRPALVLVRLMECLACEPDFDIHTHLQEQGWIDRNLGAYEPIADAYGFRVYKRQNDFR